MDEVLRDTQGSEQPEVQEDQMDGLERLKSEIETAEDFTRTVVWTKDAYRRIDYILYEAPSLGKAVRERMIYAPAKNSAGKIVGYFFQRSELEQVI